MRPDPVTAMLEEAYRFDFFHALRRIECHHADKPRLGTARSAGDEPVRLGQAPDLSFAQSALSAVHLKDRQGRPLPRPRIEVRFFGLFGPGGPLPLHLTAFARERMVNDGDETFARFADMFHHRLLLLFYRAWAQAQPAVSHDRPEDDRFADFVGSLIGVGGAPFRGRDAVAHVTKLFFSGVLSRQVRNAQGLSSLLSGYLRRPVRVEEFVGRWMTLPKGDRTRIGRQSMAGGLVTSRLGAGGVLGRSVFDRQHHFRVHIGPLSFADFEDLLPVGAALPALRALVEQYVGFEFGWDLRLELRRDELEKSETRPTRLGRAGRLGWTTWIGRLRDGQLPALTLQPGPSA